MANRNVVTVLAVERNANTGDVMHGPHPVPSLATIIEILIGIDPIVQPGRLKVESTQPATDAVVYKLFDLFYSLNEDEVVIFEPRSSYRDPVIHPLEKHRDTLQRKSGVKGCNVKSADML